MDFYEKTAIVCRMIPEGRVSTYGQIALLCGNPRYARRVGFALGRKLTDVPAHRVVNHQGILPVRWHLPQRMHRKSFWKWKVLR